MKRPFSLTSTLALALLTLVVATGCKKEEAPLPAPPKAIPMPIASAERTSFA
jgi:predicted component of type VI protein secretion system